MEEAICSSPELVEFFVDAPESNGAQWDHLLEVSKAR